MNFDETTYQLIKSYYAGTLSPAERAAFEERMQNDAAFAEEAASYDQLHQTIQAYGDEQLNMDLTALGSSLMAAAQEETSEAVVRTFPYKRLWFAAAAVVLIGLAFLLWPKGQRSTADLYAEHFSPLPAPAARGTQDPASWDQTIKAYEQQKYAQAIAGFEMLLQDSSFQRKGEALLYKGVSLLALGERQQANEILQQITQEDFEYEPAQWYRALAALRASDIPQTKQLLQEIVKQSNHPFRVQAEALWKEL